MEFEKEKRFREEDECFLKQKLPRLDPSKFYQTTTNKIPTSREIEWKKKLFRIRKPLPKISRIIIYKEFPKQQLAFDYIDSISSSNTKELAVFACEYIKKTVADEQTEQMDERGQRKYIVIEVNELWEKYSSIPVGNRHFYEVIREGTPAHLYFDLEFLYEINSNSNGNEMVELLISRVSKELKSEYEIEIDRRHIIDLESSTPKKFSKHLIFKLPKACFSNNIHVGNFVHLVLFRIEQDKENSLPELQKLFVMNDKGKEVFFADLGVYTRNRNFRLYGSSKLGKNAILTVSPENQFTYSSEKELLMESLISRVEFSSDLRILTCGDSPKLERPLKPWKPIPLAPNESKIELNIAPQSSVINYDEVQEGTGQGTSPFPLIESFLKTIITKEVDGLIRNWIYFSTSKVITFNILRYRFCENIGRHHKSNHIYFVVDLSRRIYYQKCYDPECKAIDYHSSEKPIPIEYFADVEIEQKLLSDEYLLPDEILESVVDTEE